MPKQILLLGDSIFDNQAYVPGEPDVCSTLQAMVDPNEWVVDLWAVDGHRTLDVPKQLRGVDVVPGSRFFLSVGGNDALDHQHLLSDGQQRHLDESLALLFGMREAFRENYVAALDAVHAIAESLTVCTIYNPDYRRDVMFEHFQQPIEAALSLFNDVITQEALRRKLPVIDLRLVCDKSEDFANPIEPSFKGGRKIAEAIVGTLQVTGDVDWLPDRQSHP